MILVVGSTGSLGGQIARGLLDKGRRVRILVRPSSNHQSLVYSGAVPSYGDLKDRLSLDIACRDVDTVITTAISLGRGPGDTIESVDLAGNRNLIEAATAAGVRQFVFTSALGATPEHVNPFMAAKAATEVLLRSTGMRWTVLAPDAFMDVWLQAVVAGPAASGNEVGVRGQRRTAPLIRPQPRRCGVRPGRSGPSEGGEPIPADRWPEADVHP
jgi:NADH dehydrogenase